MVRKTEGFIIGHTRNFSLILKVIISLVRLIKWSNTRRRNIIWWLLQSPRKELMKVMQRKREVKHTPDVFFILVYSGPHLRAYSKYPGISFQVMSHTVRRNEIFLHVIFPSFLPPYFLSPSFLCTSSIPFENVQHSEISPHTC